MDLAIRHEPQVDFEATATLASEGFGVPPGTFTAARLQWLYERSFSHGSTIFGAYMGARKVGHIALVRQRIRVGDALAEAVALMDLFILKDFRSQEVVAALCGRVEQFCIEAGIRFVIGVPNKKAVRVNIRHLKLATLARLEIRMGWAWPRRSTRPVASHLVSDADPVQARGLLSGYCPVSGTGLQWTGESLWERLQNPDMPYAIHLIANLLLVSAPRRDRRLAHTLLCAFFVRPGVVATRRDVLDLTTAACRLHRLPLFVYAGRNRHLPLPGLLLPDGLRPSPMLVQVRDFSPDQKPIAFDRFESLDFDFA